MRLLSKLANRARPIVRKMQPIATVVQTATNVLGQLKEPTVFSVVNAVSGGMTAVAQAMSNDSPRCHGIETIVPFGVMIEAFRAAGADVDETKSQDGRRNAACRLNGIDYEIDERHKQVWASVEHDAVLEVCRRVVDRVLPAFVRVADSERGAVVGQAALTDIQVATSNEILKRTRPMLDGGRAILLEGRPGVGKTTIAQAIGRDAGLGRVVMIDGGVIGYTSSNSASPDRRLNEQALRMLSPGVVIVDDIDKVRIPISVFEMLRKEARLVILTANNGKHDAVLDQALMRPARIDEVFTIASDKPHRRVPFDKLDDATWNEVCEWPCAYLNEVEKRLVAHPGDLRIEELRDRMKLRTRSGEELL